MTLAAEAPDLDVLWGFAGPVAAFEHHRGWTHTFLGAPVVATAVVATVWLLHRWRLKRKPGLTTAAPVRWGLLWIFALIAALSHILLDWTNNYGIRPFFPFNPRWYSLDIVFIFEPVLFAVLLLALVAPAIFAATDSEVGARRQPFRGRGWAIFALATMAALWIWRAAEHHRALGLMQSQYYQGDPVLHVAAEPSPVNPFHWHGVAETPGYFQLADIDTRTNTVLTDPQTDTLYKPPVTLSTLVAKRSWLGHIYLDWSRFPYVEDLGAADADAGPQTTTISFRDLRFAYSALGMEGRRTTPLTGTVEVQGGRTVIRMTMDGREQK